MAEVTQRHRDAAAAHRTINDLPSRGAYAQGLADREAEILVNLRRRDRWGGGAIPDRETANDIERGHDGQWERIRGPNA